MATFNIKQGDTSPSIQYALTPTSVVLTGATVVFRFRAVGSTTWTSKSASVVTATATPTVKYDWASGDTDTAGFYEAEFVVTYSDSTEETFPNNDYIVLRIEGDETGTAEKVENIRFLVGDTDSSDYNISNENIVFALDQSGDDIYLAASICARAIAAKYATLVNTKFEGVSSDYAQIKENYYALATKLEAQSKKYGSRGLGLPAAGGLTYSDIRANDLNDDRVQPKFKQDQFANPPVAHDPERYGY